MITARPGYQVNRARISLALSELTVPLLSRIYRSGEGHLYLTRTVGDSFVDMMAKTIDELLNTARRLESLLANQPTPLGPLRLD